MSQLQHLIRTGRRNVVSNQLKIIESIAKNEPDGSSRADISKDTKLYLSTVTRLCKQLQSDGWIFKNNKQSKYHLTDKPYGYPELTGLWFGRDAIRTIYNDINSKGLLSSHKEVCVDETGKYIHTCREQEILREFAIRLGAIIEYIMIQALRPKKMFPNREGVDFDIFPIKGRDKDDVFRKWLEKAIKPMVILSEFSRLPIVKRGLAVFADKGKTPRINPSLPPKDQKNLIEKIKKMRQMDIGDPYWLMKWTKRTSKN